jgi:hypothetical protein
VVLSLLAHLIERNGVSAHLIPSHSKLDGLREFGEGAVGACRESRDELGNDTDDLHVCMKEE